MGMNKCRECDRLSGEVSTLCNDCIVIVWNHNMPSKEDLILARDSIMNRPEILETIQRLDNEESNNE